MEGCWKEMWSSGGDQRTPPVTTSSSAMKPCWAAVVVPLLLMFGVVELWSLKGSNWWVIAPNAPSISSTNIANVTSPTTISSDNPSISSGDANVSSPTISSDNINGTNLTSSGVLLVQSPVESGEISSPPPAIQVEDETKVLPPAEENEEPNAKPEKKHSSLEILEAGLSEARAAIREAKSGEKAPDNDFVPKGPMYLNASAFQRSYLEMEKRFKVFIYEEGDPPIFHDGPCKQTYAIEGNFIHSLLLSRFRTDDPSKAHLYYLPFSVTMITQVVFVPHEWSQMKRTVKDYVDVIANKYPYWNRTLGADHFMLACHDWGPELSFAVPYLYKNAIRALCNANTSERFHPSRDVSIPEILLPRGTMKGLTGGPKPSRRSILVFFAGGMHGPVRPILLEHWENKDEDVQVHQYLPKGANYYALMRKSKYCICPSGYEVASPRMVEALYVGCVPVLIKDGYVIPFSDVMDWSTFSVVIPVKDIPNLKNILMAIPQKQYRKLQARGIQVRRHFELNSPPKRYDVFHMILHSIWLRRLNIRVRDPDEL